MAVVFLETQKKSPNNKKKQINENGKKNVEFTEPKYF